MTTGAIGVPGASQTHRNRMARRFSYRLEIHMPDGDAFAISRATLEIESLVKDFEASMAEKIGNTPVTSSRFITSRPHTSPGQHDAAQVAQPHVHGNHSDTHNHVP